MKFEIQPMGHGEADFDELAEFLAEFVRNGELSGSSDRDREAACWKERMGWWWRENPFCTGDSPLGFTLRSAGGELVGFHGLIPFDYTFSGKLVPGLISSIFYVSSDYRSGSMALFFRVQRLAVDYHLVDGGPSKDVIQILNRFGYQRGGQRKFYTFFTRFGWRNRGLKPGLRLVTDPSLVESIHVSDDDRIRPQITVESLVWMAKIGSGQRQFFGVCGENGELVAYALGMYKGLPCGFRRCQIVDYASSNEDRCGVAELLAHVASNRKRIPLAKGTLALVWGVENAEPRPRRKFGVGRDSKVFFSGPKKLGGEPKAVLPVEGDFSFF